MVAWLSVVYLYHTKTQTGNKMKELEAKAKVQKAISALTNFIKGDQLEILGTTYKVAKVGKSTITVMGERKAKYTIAVSYKATVIESSNLYVYSIFNSSTEKIFTVTPAGIAELKSFN